MQEIQQGRLFLGRVPHDADLLQWLTDFAGEKNIDLGEITLVGAVKNAALGYYHQDSQEYEEIHINRHLEILHGVGNISLKDGQPFVHVHLTLSDDKCQAFGGHLVAGTTIFACEVQITEYTGAHLDRKLDKVTGLTLWE